MEDTERWLVFIGDLKCGGYSGLDPMEDTERFPNNVWRNRTFASYSGLDPMEDTESVAFAPARSCGRVLQWARSDGGY